MSITNQERAQAAGESGDHRKDWFTAGGVLSAVLASSCCIGPLALLSLGLSGAWIGNLTALDPLKPAFAAVALLFIGLGFRQVYFRPRMICEPGSVCARPRSALLTKTVLWSGHRPRARSDHDRLVGTAFLLSKEAHMKPRFASAAAAVLLATTPLAAIQTAPAAAQTASAQAELQTVMFDVENMTCTTCPITVRLAMEVVEGVRSVEVDFDTRTATVVFDPAIASPAAIGSASTNAGYPAAARS